jgi:hypothetical protein
MTPKIIFVSASGDYSAALSSAGDVYTFGYGGGNQIGYGTPHSSGNNSSPSLPYVEPGPKSRTGAGHRVRESCSFDSQLNVLLPMRVELTRHMSLTVDKVCIGPSNMIMLCSSRTNGDDENMVGMTLYEIESRRRSLGLSKLRMLSAKKRGKSKRTDGISSEDLSNGEAGRIAESISSSEKRNDEREDAFAIGSDRKEQQTESKKSLFKRRRNRCSSK